MATIPTSPAKIDGAQNAHIERVTLGAAAVSGDSLYLDGNNGWKPVINTVNAPSAKAKCVLLGGGVMGTSFPNGSVVDAVFYGRVWGFSGLTPFGNVYAGGAAGKLDQTAPSVGGTFTSKIGYAWDALSIFIDPQAAEPTAN